MFYRVNLKEKEGGRFTAMDVDTDSSVEAYNEAREEYPEFVVISVVPFMERICRGGNCDE